VILEIKKRLPKLLCYGLLLLFSCLAFFPISWLYMSSLKTNTEISASPLTFPDKLQWQNYRDAWQQGKFSIYIWNSAIVSTTATFFVIILSSLAGYAFAKMRFRGENLIFFIFFFGMTVPNPVVIGPLLTIIYSLHLINTLWSLILPYVALGLPFGILIMRAFFRELPNELVEAAKIDGCSALKLLTYIIFPLALPAVFVLVVITFINCWNEFYFAVILINDSSKNTLPLGLRAFQGEYVTNSALQFTGINIVAVIPILIYVVFQKSFIKGATAGSLK